MQPSYTQTAFEVNPDDHISRLNAYLRDVLESTGKRAAPELVEAYRKAVDFYLENEEAGPGILYGFGLALTKNGEQRAAVADAFFGWAPDPGTP